MITAPVLPIDPAAVLGTATLRAGHKLGLTQAEIGVVVGRYRTNLKSINPDEKCGEIAALLVRLYRSLFVLVGGDQTPMKHWMEQRNQHTGGIPMEQIQTVTGLVEVLGYLDAIRGKT